MTNVEHNQFSELRTEMVEQITVHARQVGEETGREVLGIQVLAIMGQVPRHEFVPAELRAFAYFDTPLPIGYEKTISQPYIVALMTDLLNIQKGDRVLEVGTGLGYHAAVLASLAGTLYSVELIEELAHGAERRLREQGFENVEMRTGDGSLAGLVRRRADRAAVPPTRGRVRGVTCVSLGSGTALSVP